jgi:DNA-binding MarR family transcriptional regulator
VKLSEGGFLIAKIHQLSGRIFSRKLKEVEFQDFNPAQGRILFALWQSEGISIRELAKKTALSKSTLTSMLDRLEQSGHLERVSSKTDRRQIHLKLKKENDEFKNAFLKVSGEMIKIFYNDFSKKEIEIFENYLRKIFSNLIQFEEQGNGK